jgi:hypothetical protein
MLLLCRQKIGRGKMCTILRFALAVMKSIYYLATIFLNNFARETFMAYFHTRTDSWHSIGVSWKQGS